MSDNNKRSETTDSFRRVLQYTDIVCSVLILLVAFFIEHSGYLFDRKFTKEIGFFYLEFSPFDFGIFPICYPVAIACCKQPQLQAEEFKLHHILRPVIPVLVAYCLTLILSFLLSHGNPGTYVELSVGKTTNLLAKSLYGIPYILEVALSLCISAVVWNMVYLSLSAVCNDIVQGRILGCTIYIALNTIFPEIGIGQCKPYCSTYTWLGSSLNIIEKHIINIVAIAALFIIIKAISRLKSKTAKLSNVAIVIALGILSIFCNPYIFQREITAIDTYFLSMSPPYIEGYTDYTSYFQLLLIANTVIIYVIDMLNEVNIYGFKKVISLLLNVLLYVSTSVFIYIFSGIAVSVCSSQSIIASSFDLNFIISFYIKLVILSSSACYVYYALYICCRDKFVSAIVLCTISFVILAFPATNEVAAFAHSILSCVEYPQTEMHYQEIAILAVLFSTSAVICYIVALVKGNRVKRKVVVPLQ